MTKFIKVICKNCNKIFHRPKGRYNEAIKFCWNQYCSIKCQFEYKTTKKEFSCENCGKKIIRTPSAVSPHSYCSHSCAAVINNKKYDHRRILPSFKICKQCGQKYRKSTNNKKYCSRKCRTEATRYMPEELLNIIKKYFKKLKRVPTRRELPQGINEACRKSFGTWNRAVSTAGLIPNRSHNDRMYKRATAKAIDGHLCDSISELLIDNWFYKNNILHERDAHYPNTNHKADWKIFIKGREFFVEYFGLANDSPRYDRCIKEKINLCNKNKISLIEIYPKDLYPKNFLEDNLKNKFKGYLT
jgi:hypothetical protein